MLVMGDTLARQPPLLADLPGGREARTCRSASTPAAPSAHAPTYSGWPSYQVEDYVAQRHGVRERADQLHRRRRVPAISEARSSSAARPASPGCRRCCGAPTRNGAACAPRCRGSTAPPADIVREHVRFTLQPVDAPATRRQACRAHSTTSARTRCCCSRPTIRTGISTATEALPDGLPEATMRKMLVDNPLATYPAPARRGYTSAESRKRAEEKVPVNAPVLEKSLHAAAGDRRLRHPSDPQVAGLAAALSLGALAGACQDLRRRMSARVSIGQLTHPRMMAAGQRADAYPADGGPPGSDLPLMRKQHLDPQRRRDRHAGRARARRHGRAEPGFRGRAVARGQRLAARGMGEAGAAATRRRRGAAGRSGHRVAEIERGAPQHRRSARSSFRRAPPSRSDAAATGRSSRPREAPASRSGCIRPAPAAAIRRPAPAGRPITCRSTIRSRPACRA